MNTPTNSHKPRLSVLEMRKIISGETPIDRSKPVRYLNRRAEKIRNSYRQRIDQLQSSQKELKSLSRDFEADTREATGEMQKRIDAFKAKVTRQAKSKGPQVDETSAEDLANFK